MSDTARENGPPPVNGETGLIKFEELFDLEEIQTIQDQFAKATGVASIITRPDGTPITEPSNFCGLCRLIRRTGKGLKNCHNSDAALGKSSPAGPIMQPCLSGGLWDGGAGISAGGKHIANWLIGQVRNETQSEEKMLAYAREIGADEDEFRAALAEVKIMPTAQFREICGALFLFANQLSKTAYQNYRQKRLLAERERAEEALRQSEEKFRLLTEKSLVGVYIFQDARIVYVNPSLAGTFGYSPEEVTGKLGISDLFGPDHVGLAAERLRERLDGKSGDTIVYKVLKKDGTPFFVQSHAMRVDYQGRPAVMGTMVDITETRRAEAALRDSEARYKTLFSDAAEGMLVVDLRTKRFLYGNPAVCRMLGYKEEELMRLAVMDIHPKEKVAGVLDVLAAQARGEKKTAEVPCMRSNGEVFCASVTTAKITIDGRECALGFFTDITERKQAEEALLESETRYREIVELAVDGILMGSADGKIIDANSRMQKLAGRPLDKLLGLPVDELFGPAELGAEPLRFDLLKEGRTVITERNLLRPDGTTLPVEMHSKMMPGGTYQSIYRDISGRRLEQETQLRFELLFRNNPALMALTTLPDRIFYDVNDAFLKALGYARDEVIGKTSAELGLFPKPEQQAETAEELKAQGKVSGLEQLVRRRDGAVLSGLFSGDVVSIRGRQYFLTVMTDITERKRLEEEKERLNASLLEKNREMENFLYITTHDLRSPLVNIQGFSQNLERYLGELRRLLAALTLPPGTGPALEKLTAGSMPEALKFVLESARKMDALIASLLAVSRLGRVEMKPETVEMNALLKTILASLRYHLEDAGGEVKCGSLPPCKADKAAVSQIFTNLLDNAVKYRDKDRPLVVNVTGEVKGNMAVYTVADNGSGIPAADLEKVWSVFYQGRAAKAPGKKGEGIGLHMVKLIAEKNGGGITVDSKEREGAVFSVRLPAAGEGL